MTINKSHEEQGAVVFVIFKSLTQQHLCACM